MSDETKAAGAAGHKPCPFCGGVPVVCTVWMGLHWIACASSMCPVSTRSAPLEEAWELWDRRAPDAELARVTAERDAALATCAMLRAVLTRAQDHISDLDRFQQGVISMERDDLPAVVRSNGKAARDTYWREAEDIERQIAAALAESAPQAAAKPAGRRPIVNTPEQAARSALARAMRDSGTVSDAFAAEIREDRNSVRWAVANLFRRGSSEYERIADHIASKAKSEGGPS